MASRSRKSSSPGRSSISKAKPAGTSPLISPLGRLLLKVAFILLCVAGIAYASSGGMRYTGRVLYRINKAPAAGVLVELVEAEDDGQPDR